MKIKYTYQFSNENITIEVEEDDYNILISIDCEEYNSNRKHIRRYPESFESFFEKGSQADSEGQAIYLTVKNQFKPYQFTGTSTLDGLIDTENRERIRAAVDKLKPAQRELITAIYFKGLSVNDYAKREGVDPSAISHRLQTAYKNLKKLL